MGQGTADFKTFTSINDFNNDNDDEVNRLLTVMTFVT